MKLILTSITIHITIINYCHNILQHTWFAFCYVTLTLYGPAFQQVRIATSLVTLLTRSYNPQMQALGVEFGPGCSPGFLRAVELLAPLSLARGITPSLQTTVSPPCQPRPPCPEAPVKRSSQWTIRVCLPSVGRSGYRALRRSRSAPCDADATP
jgi:hypothetical protein